MVSLLRQPCWLEGRGTKSDKQQSTISAQSPKRRRRIGSTHWTGSNLVVQVDGGWRIDCVKLWCKSFYIINIDNRREFSILSPILMIWSWWIRLILQPPWVTSADYFFWPQSPWVTSDDPRLLGSIFVWKGVTDSSRIISIDDTRRIAHILSSALMSGEEFRYMRLRSQYVPETRPPLVNVIINIRGVSGSIWTFIVTVAPMYKTPRARASFLVGGGLFYALVQLPAKILDKK